MRLTLCEVPTHERPRPQQRGLPVLFTNSVWDLENLWTLKGCGTGPTVYCPYPRRLQSLSIHRRHYKGRTFYSVILRPWVLARPRFWTCDLPHSTPLLKHPIVGTTHRECRVRNQTQSTMVIGLPSPRWYNSNFHRLLFLLVCCCR